MLSHMGRNVESTNPWKVSKLFLKAILRAFCFLGSVYAKYFYFVWNRRLVEHLESPPPPPITRLHYVCLLEGQFHIDFDSWEGCSS